MAEFIGETEKSVNIGEPVVFENKTDSAFEVSAGVVFHKSGIYEVSVLKNKTIVSKVTERKKCKDIFETVIDHHCEFKCSLCGKEIGEVWLEHSDDFNYCPFCGAELE